jgi:hypothetical protein
MADVGRPLIYSDPLVLATQCESYFAECEEKGEKPTITGLTFFLGFADKTTLYDYRDRPEFSHPIKRSLLRVEASYEKGLRENNVAGVIFALKNMGWKDKTETDMNLTGQVPIQIIMPPDEGNTG